MTRSMKTRLVMTGLAFGALAIGAFAQEKVPGMALIPAGAFEMGGDGFAGCGPRREPTRSASTSKCRRASSPSRPAGAGTTQLRFASGVVFAIRAW